MPIDYGDGHGSRGGIYDPGLGPGGRLEPATTIPGWTPVEVINDQSDLATIQANTAADSTVIPIAYGPVQLGGKVFAADYHPDDKVWTLGFLLCLGEIESIDAVWLNGAVKTAGTTIVEYLGTDSQLADSLLVAAIASYADDLVYDVDGTDVGVAYLVVEYPHADYPNGWPTLIAEIKGKHVFNPDTSTTAYFSDVPALALRDLLTSSIYGYGDAVNDADVSAVKADNEATVTTEERRKLGLVFDRPLPIDRVRQILETYAACWAMKEGAEWRMISDRPGSTDKTLTLVDFVRDSCSITFADPSNIPTAVRVAYSETGEDVWRTRDDAVAELAGVTTGTVPRIESRLSLPGIQRFSQAEREANERLNKLQRVRTFTGTLVDDHLDVLVGDIINVTHAGLNLSADLFRVLTVKHSQFGRLAIAGLEYDATDYDDSEGSSTYGAGVFNLGATGVFDTDGNLLSNIDFRNDLLVTDALGALNANPSMEIPADRDGTLGPASYIGDGASAWPVYVSDGVRDTARTVSSDKIYGAAMRVNPDTEYEITALVRMVTTTTDIDMRVDELDTELPTGKQYVADSTQATTGSQANTRVITGTDNGSALPNNQSIDNTTWEIMTGVYVPTATALWFSPSLYNSGTGNDFDTEWLVVRERSTLGARWQQNIIDQPLEASFEMDFSENSFAALLRRWSDPALSGTAEEAIVSETTTPAPVGGEFVYEIGNNSGDDRLGRRGKLAWKIPIVEHVLYKVTFVWRQKEGFASAQEFYGGVAGIKADGVTPINTIGTETWGSQNYVSTGQAGQDRTNASWVSAPTFGSVGWFVNNGLAVDTTGNTRDDPFIVDPLTKFVVPIFYANDDPSSMAGTVQIGYVNIESDLNTVDVYSAQDPSEVLTGFGDNLITIAVPASPTGYTASVSAGGRFWISNDVVGNHFMQIGNGTGSTPSGGVFEARVYSTASPGQQMGMTWHFDIPADSARNFLFRYNGNNAADAVTCLDSYMSVMVVHNPL